MAAAYGWLVAHGLWHAFVAWCVGFTMGIVIVKWLGSAVRREIHQIADRLSTSTQGGLRDVVEAVERLRLPGGPD